MFENCDHNQRFCLQESRWNKSCSFNYHCFTNLDDLMENEIRESLRQMICSTTLGICVCPSTTIRGQYMHIDVCLRRCAFGEECLFSMQCSALHSQLECRQEANDHSTNVSVCACKIPLLWDKQDRVCFDSKEAQYNLIMTSILGVALVLIFVSIIVRKYLRFKRKNDSRQRKKSFHF